MSDRSIEQSWATVETLTTAIHSAANDEDWSTVLHLSSDRHLRLQTHFEAFPDDPGNADFYRVHIGRMMNGENDLQQLVRAARKSLMSEGLSMQVGKRALSAYKNATTMS